MNTGNLSRRKILTNFGIGSAAALTVATLSPLGIAAPAQAASRRGITDLEVDVLNFALNLEYLEAEFYSYAVTGAGLPSSITKGVGTEGPTTGGVAVNFTNDAVRALATELYNDELSHVKYLRKVLGSAAVGKPAIRLDPLGSFATEDAFLVYSRAFEDVGVSAYGGAAGLLRTSAVISAAARILAVEAYHSGAIRELVAQRGIAVTALDSKDQPPTLTNLAPTVSNSLSITRSTKAVIKIVTPFFPKKLNGKIR